MGYSINVSHNGVHVFRTDEKSLVSENQAKIVFLMLKNRFTEADGFKVTCTEWTKTGKDAFK